MSVLAIADAAFANPVDALVGVNDDEEKVAPIRSNRVAFDVGNLHLTPPQIVSRVNRADYTRYLATIGRDINARARRNAVQHRVSRTFRVVSWLSWSKLPSRQV